MLISFKNFKKALKKELETNNEGTKINPPDSEFNEYKLNSLLNLPNIDLTIKEVDRDPIDKSILN